MIPTYSDYLSTEKSLSIEEMQSLHTDMLSEMGTDPDAAALYDELLQTATRYAAFRSQWCLWSREEKANQDPSRTSCHNSLIVKFNQLARYLKMQGKSAEWRDILGYEEEDKYNRKRIGDFACFVVFVNSINAR